MQYQWKDVQSTFHSVLIYIKYVDIDALPHTGRMNRDGRYVTQCTVI